MCNYWVPVLSNFISSLLAFTCFTGFCQSLRRDILTNLQDQVRKRKWVSSPHIHSSQISPFDILHSNHRRKVKVSVCTDHSFTCKLHHTCLYVVGIHQMVPPQKNYTFHLIFLKSRVEVQNVTMCHHSNFFADGVRFPSCTAHVGLSVLPWFCLLVGTILIHGKKCVISR